MQSPYEGYKPLHDELPGEEVCSTDIEEWYLAFEGSSTQRGVGLGVIFYTPDGTSTSLAYKLDFPFTNNEVPEYKALIIGLTSVMKMRIRRFQI